MVYKTDITIAILQHAYSGTALRRSEQEQVGAENPTYNNNATPTGVRNVTKVKRYLRHRPSRH